MYQEYLQEEKSDTMQIVFKTNLPGILNDDTDDFNGHLMNPRFGKWKTYDEEDDGIIYFVSPKNVVWTLERCLKYFSNRKLIFGDREEQYKVLRILDLLVDEHERSISYFYFPRGNRNAGRRNRRGKRRNPRRTQ